MRFLFLSMAVALSLGFTVQGLVAAPPVDDAARLEFFETHIRPVLVKHCLECHGDGDIEGGLSLLSAAAWASGGDSGPAIVPGNPDESLLMQALEYDVLEMPPAGKLPDAVRARFREWIASGAFDPRAATHSQPPAKRSIDIERGKQFWSFQPLKATAAPPVQDSAWPTGVIDQYLLAAREAQQLPSVGGASPETLLRRVTFDLTGLPPSPDQIDAFVAAPSERHYHQIIDRLLQKPAYAEHWARHWLDVARYADSNGSDFNATFHHAWRYRDYVVDALATDKPFNQFVAEQIAGDLLPATSDRQREAQIVATGFLMLGAKMLSERNKAKLEMDVVDEQIDTVGRAFLGLTLGCARCHDHKFDPIPTADYYALAGIFRSTKTLEGESQKYVSTWQDVPLPAAPEHRRAVEDFRKREQELTASIKRVQDEIKQLKTSNASLLPGTVVDDAQASQRGDWTVSTLFKGFVGSGYLHDNNQEKGKRSLTFETQLASGQYEVRLAYNGGSTRAKNVPVEITHADGTTTVAVDQTVTPKIDNLWVSLGTFSFAESARLVVTTTGTSGYVIVDAVQFLPIDPKPQAAAAADKASQSQQQRLVADAEAELKRFEAALRDLRKQQPRPLPMAMAVRDQPGKDTFVCIRGEVDNPGETVRRGFLQVCGAADSLDLPEGQSGRLQLAQRLTDPDHPLPARVFVNRVWMHLFGEGIVRSVDNFGALGDRPSHPELLDRLAIDFMRDDWSTRRLVRRIVLSRSYRQASTFDAAAFKIDPENRLLWRAHRRRLPAEAIRDTLLLASGTLDRTPTIRPMAAYGTLVSKNVATPGSVAVAATSKRTIHLPIIRGYVPDLLTVFDFADPDMLVGKRPRTNVPAQALLLLNHPRVIQWSQQIAQQTADGEDTAMRLNRLYQLCLQRSPTAEERQLATPFLAAEPDPAVAWALLAQTLIASTEFRYLD